MKLINVYTLKNILGSKERGVLRMIRIVFILFLLLSCEEFIEVDPPDTQISSSTIFANDGTAKAAIANVYSQINISAPSFASGGRTSITFLQGLSADELTVFSTSGESFYLNNILPTDGNVSSIWSKCYNIIYAANAIIEGLINSQGVTTSLKDQLVGEATFMRAFCHFYLVNLWGDIPYVRTTDYKSNSNVSRIPVSQVYQFIIEDLLLAATLLSNSYPSASKSRPNKWTAVALLSRAYLYNEDWANAEQQASAIINQTNIYNLESDLNKVFLRTSGEAIWQLLPATGSFNSFDGETFILTGTPQWCALNNDLVNSFEVEDLRKDKWVGSVVVGSNIYYFPFKYKKKPADVETEYSMILRLTEQYLIRAEARAKQDKTLEAIADLDAIRQRAGLPLIANITPSINKTDLLLAIERERRFELFAEWGHRWFDLKRTGRSEQVLGAIKPGWQNTDVLLPIPETEILRNRNLIQNSGY